METEGYRHLVPGLQPGGVLACRRRQVVLDVKQARHERLKAGVKGVVVAGSKHLEEGLVDRVVRVPVGFENVAEHGNVDSVKVVRAVLLRQSILHVAVKSAAIHSLQDRPHLIPREQVLRRARWGPQIKISLSRSAMGWRIADRRVRM